MTKIVATRYHDISCGHRVHGHESKCAYLHGHNYRIHFTIEADQLDSVGRVLDFSAIKSKLCMWLEEHWDHKFLAWSGDTFMAALMEVSGTFQPNLAAHTMFYDSIVWVPFNPTAENMAQALLEVIGPQQLKGTGCRLVAVTVEETRKCEATADLRLTQVETGMIDLQHQVDDARDAVSRLDDGDGK